MDKFKIDSHKLIYHAHRVNDWLEGKNICPIYIEISLHGSCNHRCTYCALDFMKYQFRSLDADLLKKRISEMSHFGVKSIMYAGEGEPLLHKDISQIIKYTKESGIDVAITTNGVLLKESVIDEILEKTTWIKVSINGATKKTYAAIHRASPDDFDKVMRNMSYAADLRRKKNYGCALGMQLLLLPENSVEVVHLAKKAKDLGMDYLVVKPYSQHPLSKTTKYKNIKYGKYLQLADELNRLNDKQFSVIFRIHAMKKWDDAGRNYKHCLALPFWAYIDAGGNVWNCSAYLTDERFKVGNIYNDTFRQIWNSKKRHHLVRWVENQLDSKYCRVNCRMDEINRYLWDLKHPPAHVNFI